MGLDVSDPKTYWQKEEEPPLSTSLSASQSADVVIVGAGISGLSVAYQLLRQGYSVSVLDRDQVGHGETSMTSAHLSNVMDEGLRELRRLHGSEGARLAVQSHAAAIDEIEQIVQREKIDCEFKRLSGFLFLGPDEEMDDLWEELEASQLAGFRDVEMIRSSSGGTEAPLLKGPYLKYPRQAQFHPLKYLNGLVAAIRRMGGQIYSHTEVTEVEGGSPARVATREGFEITAAAVVVAANVPFNDRFTLHTKMAPYRTYMIGMRAPQVVPDALYWDTADPYHYIRFVQDPLTRSKVMLIGGEDHRTGQSSEGNPYEKLRAWADRHFGLTSPVTWHWSGQVLEPHDGLAYIGRNPGDEDNVYVVTGDSGQGLTHATIAGLLIRDLIQGRENPWQEIYDPSRVNLKSLNTFVVENLHSATPYGDWITPGDVNSVAEIPAGEGAVIREGLHILAVCKETSGRVHAYSAICPHLNGVVRWNSLEKTWDCPCHGSRFDRWGKVLNGPSVVGLKEVPLAGDEERGEFLAKPLPAAGID